MRLPIHSFARPSSGNIQLLKSSIASVVLRLLGLAASFALGVILARTLGPAQFGIYGLVIAISAVAVNVALLGVPQLAVREFAAMSHEGLWVNIRSLAKSFLVATTLASTLIGVIAVFSALLILDRNENYIIHSVIGAGITVALTLTALAAAELRGLGSLTRGQIIDATARPALAIFLVGAFLLMGKDLDAKSALLLQMIAAIVGATISLAWLRSIIGSTIRSSLKFTWVRDALPLGAVDVLRQLEGTYGIILMGLLGAAVDVGVFRVAVACGVIASLPVTVLHVVFAPQVSRLYRSNDFGQLQRLLKLASFSMIASTLPMLIVLTLFGKQMIMFAFGPAYGDAWLPVAIMTAGQVVFGAFGMGPILLAMTDGAKHLMRIYATATLIGVGTAVVGIAIYGAVGAAIGQFVSTALIAAMSGRFARKVLKLETLCLRRGTEF